MYQHKVDFIVIGAGSAGAALTHRLTESGKYRVLLLEAGKETHPLAKAVYQSMKENQEAADRLDRPSC